MINFVQPRIGTRSYGTFSNHQISTIRYTHNRDRVPHLPFEEIMSYYHVCTEYFKSLKGSVKVYNPTCADQYSFNETNWHDNGYYLGLPISCFDVS